MERSQVLVGVAGLLLLAVVLFYGWRWCFSTPRQPSAEELAQAALTAGKPEEKIAAAAELTARGWPAIPQMQRVLGESNLPEVRAAMIQGLVAQWDFDSMPAFLDGLDDPSLVVRARSEAAVRRIERFDSGYQPEASPEQRREAVKALRDRWTEMRDSPMIKRARENLKAQRQNSS